MQQILLDEFKKFTLEVRETSFTNIKSKFIENRDKESIGKFIGEYVPKLYQYELEFDQHTKQFEEWKKIPAFDGKKDYHNNDNLHRRVISIFKAFILSEVKDLREYLRLTVDIDQLSSILSRIEILRFKSSEFNLLYHLFTAGKKSIRIYTKLREEIIKESSFSKIKYHPISTHNSAKYTEKYHYLDKVTLSRKKRQWEELINLTGFVYDDEFTSLAFDNHDEIPAVELIEYCLWLNRQVINSSPTK